MRLASLLLVLFLPAAASAQDSGRGRLLYETHCGTCHYERVHQRIKSDVKDLADLRDTVARWASQTRHNFTLDELEEVVAYLNESHYRFGLPPGSRRELIYGAELMSEQELDDYRAQLAGAPSDAPMRRLAAALLASPALAFAAGDAANGERLQRSCLQCHGTEVYVPGATIKTLAALRKETVRWGNSYNPKFTRQEIDDLVAYLNRDFYKLP